MSSRLYGLWVQRAVERIFCKKQATESVVYESVMFHYLSNTTDYVCGVTESDENPVVYCHTTVNTFKVYKYSSFEQKVSGSLK